MRGVWDSPEGKAIPTKTYKPISRQSFTLESQKKFGYKTNYKNHNWPKRKQSLQLQRKVKYNLKYVFNISNKIQ